jgi:acyl-CoA synthetase (AMP-forming)/AMP-acid ligase II
VFDHANLEAVAAGADVLSHPGDRRLSPLPFAHVGYMTRTWDEIAHGITTVITPTPWRADETLSILEAERVTVAQGVPTQWALILELPALDQTDLRALRIAGTGAARMAAEQVRALADRLGVPVVVRYTSTESSLGTGTVPQDSPEVVATTVGRPVPGVELRLVDDEGHEARADEVGRVWLRSKAVMRGYWADREPGPDRPGGAGGWRDFIDPEATAAAKTDDGWVRTGDFGRLDPSGNLTLVGRDNELYIRGGYNVLPSEVEAALLTDDRVREVAVVGAPDPVLGEVGVAFVVLEPVGTAPTGSAPVHEDVTLEALRQHCRGQLADYKAPDALVVLEELPLTPMMKIDRRLLGAMAAPVAAQRPRPVAARPG